MNEHPPPILDCFTSRQLAWALAGATAALVVAVLITLGVQL